MNMTKRIILTLALFSACNTVKPTRVIQSNNPSANVVELFTADGCTIYRFEDDGSHYFAHCRAGGISLETSRMRMQGKAMIRIPDVVLYEER